MVIFVRLSFNFNFNLDGRWASFILFWSGHPITNPPILPSTVKPLGWSNEPEVDKLDELKDEVDEILDKSDEILDELDEL